jgi:uncharacterized protein (TIGR02391 family)
VPASSVRYDVRAMNDDDRRRAEIRLAQLMEMGRHLAEYPVSRDQFGRPMVDWPAFQAFRTAGQHALDRFLGPDHAYAREFRDSVTEPSAEDAKTGANILQMAHDDLRCLDIDVRATNGAISLEDLLHAHIREHAYSLFLSGAFREAVFNSAVAVFDLLRIRTGLAGDGSGLATEVFNLSKPRLLVADITTATGRSEQLGVMQMLQGFYAAARNPKAHTLAHETTREVAAEYLVVASYLSRRISQATPAGA